MAARLAGAKFRDNPETLRGYLGSSRRLACGWASFERVSNFGGMMQVPQPQDPSTLIAALEWIWRILTILVLPPIFILVKQIFTIRQATALLEQRTCALEEQIKLSPGNELTVSLTELKGEFKALRETMAGLTAMVGRHEEYLWKHGGRQ
jgi:hypothetical protein